MIFFFVVVVASCCCCSSYKFSGKKIPLNNLCWKNTSGNGFCSCYTILLILICEKDKLDLAEKFIVKIPPRHDIIDNNWLKDYLSIRFNSSKIRTIVVLDIIDKYDPSPTLGVECEAWYFAIPFVHWSMSSLEAKNLPKCSRVLLLGIVSSGSGPFPNWAYWYLPLLIERWNRLITHQFSW